MLLNPTFSTPDRVAGVPPPIIEEEEPMNMFSINPMLSSPEQSMDQKSIKGYQEKEVV